jgi:hypothetical protein
VDYAEARAAFFSPRTDAAAPGSDAWDLPGRRLRDALEPIATICFWAEPAYDAYAALGLDFLTGYVWSRACVLGEPEGTVVASAFGVFAPGLIVDLYDTARAACPLAEIRRARLDSAVAALGECGVDAGDTADVLSRCLSAADPTGRPLYSGLRALPEPSDPLGRLFHVCAQLREFRGDSHVASYVSAGLTGLEANLLTERWVGWDPTTYTATRGWTPDDMSEATKRLTDRGLLDDTGLSDAGRELREEIEARTEAQLRPLVEAAGSDLERAVSGAEVAAQQIVDRGWFPPDPYKRASG